MAVTCAGLLAGCAASVPPSELIDARQSYSHASVGQAAHLVPAELAKARWALVIAEKAFQDKPNSFRTRDLAYIADRKAKIAEALAATFADSSATTKANEDFQTVQTEIARSAKPEYRPALAHAILARIAVVKKGVRGLVISLSDSALFDSNASVLLPAAQDRLNGITTMLLETNDRMVTVECYTDPRHPSRRDQQLSQRRADAVRSYMISRGYAAALIQAHGIAEPRSVEGDARTGDQAEGSRLEIIIDYAAR